MKTILLVFCAILTLHSCVGRSNQKKIAVAEIPKEDTIHQTSIDTLRYDNEYVVDREYLNGIWTLNQSENAIFVIQDNKLTYVEDQDNPIEIALEGNILTMHDGLPTDIKILKADKDSLCFFINDEIIRLIRME